MNTDSDAIHSLLQDYFDGLYHSDIGKLAKVFHPDAQYVSVSEGSKLHLNMADYFDKVSNRLSPASKGEARHDKVELISFAGDDTAMVRVTCKIAPCAFIDFLSLIKLDGRWQIISKVFHTDIQQGV